MWAAFVLILVQIYLGTQVREEIDIASKALGYENRAQWLEQVGSIFEIHRSFVWLLLAALIFLIARFKKLGELPNWLKWSAIVVGLEMVVGVILNASEFSCPSSTNSPDACNNTLFILVLGFINYKTIVY